MSALPSLPSLPSLLPSLPSSLPQPFSSLSLLLAAEEEDSKRIRVSKLGWWVDVKRIKGSTLARIWRAVLGFSLWSAVVAMMEILYGKELGLTNNVTPLLSVVVGLLLVFRNSTAYARWDDGRKAFGSMTSTVRSLSRTIWVNVGAFTPPGRVTSEGLWLPTPDVEMNDKDGMAKIQALRFLVAFVVATKHHLRREWGTDYPDLTSLLPSTFCEKAGTTGYGYSAAEADAATSRRRSSASSNHHHLNGNEAQSAEFTRLSGGRRYAVSESRLNLSKGKDQETSERSPLFQSRRKRNDSLNSLESGNSTVILSNYMSKPSLPLPLIIAHQLSLYLALCKRKGLLESVGPAGFNALQQSVTSLVDGFTTVERLGSIGIPTVYGIHLKQCVSLFLFTLPFTLVEAMGWKMVPFVSVCAFTLIGIEGIASEIEQPFGLDMSDLPLDLVCAELRNEVEHMIARLPTHSTEWM